MKILFQVITAFLFPLSLYSQSNIEDLFIERVSREQLQQTVRDLVQYGNRIGGTISGNRASQYVFNKFKDFGLRAEKIAEPSRSVYHTNSWSLRIVRPKYLSSAIRNEWIASNSPSVKRKRAKLVFYSNGENNYRQLDSSVVLVSSTISANLYNSFLKAGTVCILSYETNNIHRNKRAAYIQTIPKGGKIPMFNLPFSSGEKLRISLQKGTKIIIEYAVNAAIIEGIPKTIVGTLKGKTDDYYIICAHGDSDSGGPGADDNASGVSAVIELGRILNELVKESIWQKPAFSLKFIVWGNEYSSAENFINKNVKTLSKIKGVINYDQLASGATRKCIYFESNDVTHNYNLMKVIEKVGIDFAGKSGFWKEATTNPSQGGTDSYVFLLRSLERLNVHNIEIPSITVYTAAWDKLRTIRQTEGWFSPVWKGPKDSVIIDYSPFYHTSLDVPTLTSERYGNRIEWGVKAVGLTLLRLASEEKKKK